MNWNELFDTQLKLDYKIKKQKGLHLEDLRSRKILALHAELGELSNEWRGFKFWSENKEPRTKIEHLCPVCNGDGYYYVFPFNELGDVTEKCEDCDGKGKIGESNPLLEEYVDCLHFILSLGNDIGFATYTAIYRDDNSRSITEQFNDVHNWVSILNKTLDFDVHTARNPYIHLVGGFLNLGYRLGLSFTEIEQAYHAKNKVNHERQANGY